MFVTFIAYEDIRWQFLRCFCVRYIMLIYSKSHSFLIDLGACVFFLLSLSLGFRQAFTSLRCALYFPIAHFFQWRSSFFLSFNCLFIFSDGATCVTHMNSQRTQKTTCCLRAQFLSRYLFVIPFFK